MENKAMTVGDIRYKIKDLPDNMEIKLSISAKIGAASDTPFFLDAQHALSSFSISEWNNTLWLQGSVESYYYPTS